VRVHFTSALWSLAFRAVGLVETLEADPPRTDQLPELRPQGQWALAWRRFKRDRVAVACGIFLHLLLPWITFALFFVALYMRIVRARMLEVLEEPWVRTARAKGASELRVIRSHALRNAIAPVVTMTAMDAGMAIGVAMYIETVFGLPGLGRTLIRALAGLQGYDLPVILAVTLVAAAAIIVLNLVADIVLLAIDPTVARRGRGVQRLLGRAA
jgi:ABC-type dipeptide/oligopeptide/nickel transport system permease component